ncbi:YdcF family protein [Paenactinomyces guangxiensis]|uniref:YdcF family protein n=1 Tax=Paenactinomyces guangxiensis TaxID=1490290 RepID=A0A7W1WQ29_9BACL|nr:YdcF family protein [Paenactinomyces guangxiensis]MBA4493957.1 YdcF family protein [Paenactinomyces guangxiensis]MBH8591424.1 YdcF family protein [Paenactinomyces guangxiensis]
MKEIPRYPKTPRLSREQAEALTQIVFVDQKEFPVQSSYDLLFIFGGSHPKLWEVSAQAYIEGKCRQILVTGGYKPNVKRHSSWKYGTTPESHVIKWRLVEKGVREEDIIIEDRSTNSLENVLYAKEIFDFGKVRNLLFVCKSFASGRQYRTLKKHLPSYIQFTPLTIDIKLNNTQITRGNWMNHPGHRSLVYGEYLRIIAYGKKGDLCPIEQMIPGLEVES